MEQVGISPDGKDFIMGVLGEWGWILLVIFIMQFFRDSIQNVVTGMMVFFGNELNQDDTVILNGELARIARCGFIKTSFYIYIVDSKGEFVTGKVRSIANVNLAENIIEKPLPMFSDILIQKYKDKALKELN